jgi:hypothetical protein
MHHKAAQIVYCSVLESTNDFALRLYRTVAPSIHAHAKIKYQAIISQASDQSRAGQTFSLQSHKLLINNTTFAPQREPAKQLLYKLKSLNNDDRNNTKKNG